MMAIALFVAGMYVVHVLQRFGLIQR